MRKELAYCLYRRGDGPVAQVETLPENLLVYRTHLAITAREISVATRCARVRKNCTRLPTDDTAEEETVA